MKVLICKVTTKNREQPQSSPKIPQHPSETMIHNLTPSLKIFPHPSNLPFAFTEPFVRWKPIAPWFLLNHSLVFTESLLRLYRTFPANKPNFSFDFTAISSPRRWHGEPSPSQHRRLAKSMTNLRQLVETKGAFQPIPKFSSENPQKRFSKSPIALHKSNPLSLCSYRKAS